MLIPTGVVCFRVKYYFTRDGCVAAEESRALLRRLPQKNRTFDSRRMEHESDWLTAKNPRGAHLSLFLCVTMSDIVLHYFGSKARAESIKLALYLAHVPYKFEAVTDWPKMKEEGLKSGSLPFGQVPMLHIDGMDLVQTESILRYISMK